MEEANAKRGDLLNPRFLLAAALFAGAAVALEASGLLLGQIDQLAAAPALVFVFITATFGLAYSAARAGHGRLLRVDAVVLLLLLLAEIGWDSGIRIFGAQGFPILSYLAIEVAVLTPSFAAYIMYRRWLARLPQQR